MKLQHYLGGFEGLGTCDLDRNVFHADWEKRVFGMGVALFCNGVWTGADMRRGIENLDAADYLRFGYYERWLISLISHLVKEGVVSVEELERAASSGLTATGDSSDRGEVSPPTEKILSILKKGNSPKRETPVKPRFQLGQKVAVRDAAPSDHTRLPGFLRQKRGVVETVYPGAYIYHDTGDDGLGSPQPVYRVRFKSKDVWPNSDDANTTIFADLFEAYLAVDSDKK